MSFVIHFLFFGYPPGILAVVGAFYIALGLDSMRVRKYLVIAASHSGHSIEAYERMVMSRDDYSDIILQGINTHKSKLLNTGDFILSRIRDVIPEPLFESRTSLEDLLNEFVSACVGKDKRALRKVRRKIGKRLGKLHTLSWDVRIPSRLQKDCQKWLKDIEQWEDITLYLRRYFNKPNFRSMNL